MEKQKGVTVDVAAALAQRDELAKTIDMLVDTVETLHPESLLGKAEDLKRLELTEKVGEVKSKWLSQCSGILDQLQSLKGRCSDPVLAQKLKNAVDKLEELRRLPI